MPPTTLSYSVFGSQGPSGGRSSTPSRWKGMRPSTTVTCAPQEQRAPNTLSFGMPVRSPVSPSPPYGQGRSAIWPPPPSVVRASAVVACGGPCACHPQWQMVTILRSCGVSMTPICMPCHVSPGVTLLDVADGLTGYAEFLTQRGLMLTSPCASVDLQHLALGKPGVR